MALSLAAPARAQPVERLQGDPEEERVVEAPTARGERPPLPPAVFTGGVALTVIAAGVGGYFGISALISSEQERNDRDPRLPPDTSRIEEAALLADIFFVTAGLLAVGSIIVAILTDWGGAEDTAQDDEASVRPVLGPGVLGLEGTF